MREMTMNEITNINGGAAKQCIYCGKRFTGWLSGLTYFLHFIKCGR